MDHRFKTKEEKTKRQKIKEKKVIIVIIIIKKQGKEKEKLRMINRLNTVDIHRPKKVPLFSITQPTL